MACTPEISVDELRATTEREPAFSDWINISQDMIDDFAQITNDHQFIHIDPERARKETPFDGTIAHGFLTLSHLTQMVESTLPQIKGTAMSVNYGFDRIRFLSPVPSGSRIRGHFKLESIEEKTPGELTLYHDVTVEIEGQHKPAMAARWIIRHYLA